MTIMLSRAVQLGLKYAVPIGSREEGGYLFARCQAVLGWRFCNTSALRVYPCPPAPAIYRGGTLLKIFSIISGAGNGCC